MDIDGRTLRLENLTEIEVMELEEELGPALVDIIRAPAGTAGRHGDFGLTVAVVVLGGTAITGLAIWLAKKRQGHEEFDKTSVTLGADGSVHLDMTRIRRGSSSEPPDSATVGALTNTLRDAIQQTTASAGAGAAGGNLPGT